MPCNHVGGCHMTTILGSDRKLVSPSLLITGWFSSIFLFCWFFCTRSCSLLAITEASLTVWRACYGPHWPLWVAINGPAKYLFDVWTGYFINLGLFVCLGFTSIEISWCTGFVACLHWCSPSLVSVMGCQWQWWVANGSDGLPTHGRGMICVFLVSISALSVLVFFLIWNVLFWMVPVLLLWARNFILALIQKQTDFSWLDCNLEWGSNRFLGPMA